MSRLRSAQDVCIEYALAAQQVKEQQKIVVSHSCTMGNDEEECISRLWATSGQDDRGRSYPEPDILECDMCGNCKIRLEAIRKRAIARAKFGAAKRAVLAVGKRMIKMQQSDVVELCEEGCVECGMPGRHCNCDEESARNE